MKDQQPYSDSWEDEAPILASLPKRKPSGPPEGYFDQLPENVMARIQAMEQKGEAAEPEAEGTKVLKPGWSMPYKVWAVAAGVVLLLVASFVLVRQRLQMNETDSATMAWESRLEAVESQEIIQVLGTADLSDEDLFAALGQDVELSEELNFKGESEDVIDYLENGDLDDLDLEGIDLNDVDLM